LRNVSHNELLPAFSRYQEHFSTVIRLLQASENNQGAVYRRAVRLLTFSEVPEISLGYSKSIAGNGIGPGLAWHLTGTALEIVRAGITDPVIFDLIGLLEEGIGADRISDMTARIILPQLMGFSQIVAHNLGISTRQYSDNGNIYQLPYDENESKIKIFVPSQLLRSLPVARDWSDIDIVCAYNEGLRNVVNRLIGDTWKHATSKVPKYVLKETLLRNPDVLRDLIGQYTAKPPISYDFTNDPNGYLSWNDEARNYASRYPISLSLGDVPTRESVYYLVLEICRQYRQLIEQNGLNRLLFKEDGTPRHEEYAQRLFYGIADSYCIANNLDISREPNAGHGPVDFKFSSGYEIRVLVEVKYSHNSHLVRGFTNQLPDYNAAERAYSSIYLVIRTTESMRNIDSLLSTRDQAVADGERVPEIFIIDGQLRPSASRL
jgi:hypothetical protein